MCSPHHQCLLWICTVASESTLKCFLKSPANCENSFSYLISGEQGFEGWAYLTLVRVLTLGLRAMTEISTAWEEQSPGDRAVCSSQGERVRLCWAVAGSSPLCALPSAFLIHPIPPTLGCLHVEGGYRALSTACLLLPALASAKPEGLN